MDVEELKRWKWPLAWLIQIIGMLLIGCASALTAVLGRIPYGIAMWGGMSAAGAVSAYRATRRGLLNYAAWIAPPVCMALAHWLVWGYVPDGGCVLVCAFVSLVGAAAGEVMNRQATEERDGK